MNELNLLQIRTSGPRHKEMKCQLTGSGGQTSSDIKVRFGGLVEASFSTS